MCGVLGSILACDAEGVGSTPTGPTNFMNTKQLHKQWRRKFNNDVFKRDNNKCCFCDIRENLDAHHITDRHEMPNGGYVLSNGITLCSFHHECAEVFHRNEGKTWYNNFHPDDLYAKIKSSYDKAYKDSKDLMPD